MKLTGMTTRLVKVDPTPRYGGEPVPAGRPQTWHFPLVALHTDEGLTGYSMGYGPHGDGRAFASLLHGVFYSELVGADVAYHEALWVRLKEKHRHLYNLSQAALGVLDVALVGFAGQSGGAADCQTPRAGEGSGAELRDLLGRRALTRRGLCRSAGDERARLSRL